MKMDLIIKENKKIRAFQKVQMEEMRVRREFRQKVIYELGSIKQKQTVLDAKLVLNLKCLHFKFRAPFPFSPSGF